MCITVNSKHNVIRKMFSVIKYLVLVFVFVFVGIVGFSRDIKALTTYIQGTIIGGYDWGNGSDKNGYTIESGAYIGYQSDGIEVVVKSGYNTKYIQKLVIDVADSNGKWIGNFDVVNLNTKPNRVYLKLYFNGSTNDGKAYLYQDDRFCLIFGAGGCWQNDVEKNVKLKHNGSTAMSFADYLAKGTIDSRGFTFQVKTNIDGLGDKNVFAYHVKNTVSASIETVTHNIIKGRDVEGVKVQANITLKGNNLTEGALYWCLYNANSNSCIKEDTTSIAAKATSITLSHTIKESMADKKIYNYLYFRFYGYGPYVKIYEDKPSTDEYSTTEYRGIINPFYSSMKPTLYLTPSANTTEGTYENIEKIKIHAKDNVALKLVRYIFVPKSYASANNSCFSQVTLTSYCESLFTGQIENVKVESDGDQIEYYFTVPENIEGNYVLRVIGIDSSGLPTDITAEYLIDNYAPRLTLSKTDDVDPQITWTNKNITINVEETNVKSDGCSYVWKDASNTAITGTGGSGSCTITDNTIIIVPPVNQESELTLSVTVVDAISEKNSRTEEFKGIKIDNKAPDITSNSVDKAAKQQHISTYNIEEGRLDKEGSYFCFVLEDASGCNDDNKVSINNYVQSDGSIHVVTINTEDTKFIEDFKSKYSSNYKENKIKFDGKYKVCFVLNEDDSIPHGTVTKCGDPMIFDNTKITLDTKQIIGISTMKDDDTSISGISPMIGNFSVRAKIEISDEYLIFSGYKEVSSDNTHISYTVKEEGKTGEINTITCEIKYSVVEQSNKQYLYIIVGNCVDSDPSAKYGKLLITVTIDSCFITDQAGNGFDFTETLNVMTVELRLGSKNDFTVQTVAKQETTSNEEKKSTQVTTLSSVVEREEILVEEIREANVKEVVIPLEETNMVIQVDETLVEITVEEVEEKETKKEIVVVVDENTEIVVINYGSMSYEYKVKEITSNLNREVILHELMVSNKRVLVKLKSMKEH